MQNIEILDVFEIHKNAKKPEGCQIRAQMLLSKVHLTT